MRARVIVCLIFATALADDQPEDYQHYVEAYPERVKPRDTDETFDQRYPDWPERRFRVFDLAHDDGTFPDADMDDPSREARMDFDAMDRSISEGTRSNEWFPDTHSDNTYDSKMLVGPQYDPPTDYSDQYEPTDDQFHLNHATTTPSTTEPDLHQLPVQNSKSDANPQLVSESNKSEDSRDKQNQFPDSYVQSQLEGTQDFERYREELTKLKSRIFPSKIVSIDLKMISVGKGAQETAKKTL